MVLIGDGRIHLAAVEPAAPSRRVDRATLGDRGEPGRKAAGGIVGVARRVHGEQNVLDDVFDPVGRDAATAHDTADQRHAGAQKPLIGRPVTGLCRRHPA